MVTAFVIETYKTLSPDSSTTIINILSVIASRGNDTGSPGGFTIPPVSDPFQVHFIPGVAAVRFNFFFQQSCPQSLYGTYWHCWPTMAEPA